MTLKLYADMPARRTAQIAADVWFVVWVVGCVWAAARLYDLVMKLAAPGRTLEDAGGSLAQNMTEAGKRVDGIPLVGDEVRAPFDRASDAAAAIARAGVSQQNAVENLATFVAVCFAVMPILLLLVIWLPLRVRFVRRASAAQRFIDSAADLDLFALRALARQPMQRLARIHEDPAGAWRRGEPDVVRALARLELRESGLRTPTTT